MGFRMDRTRPLGKIGKTHNRKRFLTQKGLFMIFFANFVA